MVTEESIILLWILNGLSANYNTGTLSLFASYCSSLRPLSSSATVHRVVMIPTFSPLVDLMKTARAASEDTIGPFFFSNELHQNIENRHLIQYKDRLPIIRKTKRS